jgi:FMN reductase
MPSIVVLAGSPSATSRTAAVLDLLALRLTSHGHEVRVVPIRELPPGPLLAADAHHPEISEVIAAVAAARGLIVASPVYKAAYTGLLKSFLDLLPQYALAGKIVLPLVTGGTLAHVLAVDYALRPVLASMSAHVGQGFFLLDQLIGAGPGVPTRIAPEAERPLLGILDAFSESLAFHPVTVTV